VLGRNNLHVSAGLRNLPSTTIPIPQLGISIWRWNDASANARRSLCVV
jgi:hypothetical protein